ELMHFAQTANIDMTVVGPEAPLVAGIVDTFAKQGLAIFGPSQAAAMIEGSKVFAKEFMRRHGIPTADFRVFEIEEAAREYLSDCAIPIVIKADGLAAGKGAIVAKSREESFAALSAIFTRRIFGEAGKRVVIEEFLPGEEVSVLCLTDGVNFITLPPAQDHKAVYDDDTGPNTGGMGAYAPAPVMNRVLQQRVEREILQPTIQGLAKEGRRYRGVLYAGLMITADGPKVVEFNCRLGDPEAQVILPLLKGDLAELMWRTMHDALPAADEASYSAWALTVVMASAGYPGDYQKGKAVLGLGQSDDENVLTFHSGTARDSENRLVTNGGRVLAVTGLGNTFEQARERAYAGVNRISFAGAHYRSDIGAKALKHLK
ncbi:phosphoribosylamine--glycine ligase, partial [candidate division KSB1 bacterium]|nr:phosphoribosylamine--glycine ligase [candidate division KSB1 bacterium]